jgi:hypothetical protein
MRNLLSILCFLLPFLATAQSNNECYVQKMDASGIDVSTKYIPLNEAACKLKNTLPIEYKDKFKVYSYGLYYI